ncbi:efflux RND transporter permease subunit [Paenactinomyces guangxiensis]|uniref:Efflux RND transporter permease subunit n=1 Tax=Paenactinomyces guangxiensis TaxID=1490290 RepID=A0A7W2A9K7_9BACL|nr:efflux RND transporter permease subunit [Paenactinomyces guangxiensis]MBA4495302.1 efflux RND transporter permease subunit [Paenactinomyces guangxiensis]MBH8592576.1 efflux RND transporter permease subunit [Paenactinomyces guangxiensis]
MNWLTRFSLKNIAAILILVLLVSGGGIYTATRLKMEAMPDINFPVVVAIIPYPGASPDDIDKKVTQPIEKAFQGIKGAQKVTSISADSTSVIIVQFDFDADLDKAQQEMKDSVSRLSLPEQVLEPTFNRFGLNTSPVMSFSVTSGKKKPAEMEHWVNEVAKGAFESVDGVGEVQVKGEGNKAVYIRLKPDQLKKYNLSVQQVRQVLQNSNTSLPVGDLNLNQIDMPVRIEQKITNIEQLKNMELTIPPNPADGFQDAFDQIGQGFQGLGQAVGGLNQAVGGLNQGLGQVGQGLGYLTLILQQGQELQAQIVGDQLALNDALSQLQANPDDPALQAKVAGLKQKIAAEQKGLHQLNKQLKQLQAKMPKPKSSSGSKSPGGSPHLAMQNTEKPTVKEAKIKTVKLSDIAFITESANGNSMITRTNGKPSVNIDILKDPNANIVEVAEQIDEKVAELKKENPDMEIATLFDQSRAVKASIHSMVREGLLGALFAAVVILIFLRNFRMTLISIVSIPVSVLATLILIHQADITLNVMTLGGLAVAIGRVVDDSIVVIENIYRHMMKKTERNIGLIQAATKEVASAITSSTMTTVAVFIPLGFVDGIVGKVFFPFAVTVAIALLCSLVVAVTIVPVLTRLMLLRGKKLRLDRTRSRTAESYKKMLAWSFNHKGIVLTLATLLLVGSLGIVPLVGTSFIPADKDKAIRVNLNMPSGTDISKTNEVARSIEKTFKKYKEVKVLSTSVGNLRGKLNSDGSVGSTNRASIFVSLDSSANMDQLLKEVRGSLKPLEKEGEIIVNEVNSLVPASSSIEVSVQGNNLRDIRLAADQLTAKLKQVKGLTNVSNNLSEQKELVTVHVDNAKAAKQGLVAQQVALSVRGLLDADKVMELEKGSRTQDVKLGLEEENLTTVDQLKQVRILSQTGKMVQLSEIATIKKEKGPVTIQKENRQQYATVSGNVTIKDTGAVSRDVQSIISQTNFPRGIKVTIGGDTEEMNKSFAQLGVAMVVAVAAVYIVMIIAFGEATAPFTILFSLPFAVIGGLVGLLITRQPISVSSMIGALMLIGIVVTNAIVLIDRVQQQRTRGLNVREALLEAAGTRLRPILMTAFATIFALLPLGLGYGEGTLISQGLAVVVIGGLASSTLLTLFIVPIMYLILSRVQERFTGRKSAEMNV